MNEIYELKKEISLLRSLNDRNESKESENSHTTNVLETKLVFLEKENSILRSELENKQKIIDLLLETNLLVNLLVTLHRLSFKILPPQIVRYQMVYTK